MTLHEAIEKLLLQTKREMTAREIADELNNNKWYSKGDSSKINPSQIIARVNNHQTLFDVNRSVSPLKIKLFGRQLKPGENKIVPTVLTSVKPEKSAVSVHTKTSFDPILYADCQILILGTMPGERSLKLGEYYGHSRNRFWKIIASITKNDLPTTYTAKKKLLAKAKMGLWDVAHTVTRKGSLDISIKNEEPNELESFIERHKNLKVVAFNGAKSENLFNKYFKKKNGIRYITLPSSSPANTGIGLADICKAWQSILKK